MWLGLVIGGLCITAFIYVYALLVIMLFVTEVLLRVQVEEGCEQNDA